MADDFVDPWQTLTDFYNLNAFLFAPVGTFNELYTFWENNPHGLTFSGYLWELRQHLAAQQIQRIQRGIRQRRRTRDIRTLQSGYNNPTTYLYQFDPLHIADIEQYL